MVPSGVCAIARYRVGAGAGDPLDGLAPPAKVPTEPCCADRPSARRQGVPGNLCFQGVLRVVEGSQNLKTSSVVVVLRAVKSDEAGFNGSER